MATNSSQKGYNGRNLGNTLAPSFLIGSCSYLQVTRTFIISRTSSKFGQIGPKTAELTALERLEKSPLRLIMEESCERSSSFIFDWINLILAGNEDMYKSLKEFKFRPDTTTNSRVICPCTSKTCCEHSSAYIFDWMFFIFFQVTRTAITSRTSSKFGQIGPRTAELTALERLEKSPLRHIMEESCEYSSSFILIGSTSFLQVTRTCMKPDTTTNSRVICPCTSEKLL